jgi:hypothetical protein
MGLILNDDTKEAYLSLSDELRRSIDKTMGSLAKEIDNNVDNLYLGVKQFVDSKPTLTKAEIAKQLKDMQQTESGVFALSAKNLVTAIDKKTFAISEDIFFGKLKTETDFMNENNDKMMWQAMFTNTCPDCLKMHGIIKPRQDWKGNGPNERDTVCAIHNSCQCNLIPIAVLPDKSEMMEPIKIQTSRIRKAEKIRGKKYAASTRKALLGQINNPDSSIVDLRKIKKVK